MHSRLFNVLHDRPDNHGLTIAYSIDIDLDGGAEKAVQQYRRILGYTNRITHVAQQVLLPIDDFHRPAPQHIGGPHHQWITNFSRRVDRFIDTAHGCVLGLAQSQLLNHLLKPFPILSTVYLVRRGADNGHAGPGQIAGQFQWRLAPELNDDPFRLLQVNDLQHILEGDRLEKESVRGVVIGGDRLGIAIDHDGFVAVFTHGQCCVDTTVVKLNALPDTIGPAAQHHNLASISGSRLTLFLIGGVHISGGSRKLGGAGIHAFVDRPKTQLLSALPDLIFRCVQQRRQSRIGEPLALQLAPFSAVQVFHATAIQRGLQCHQFLDLHQEPGINARVPGHLLQGKLGSERIGHIPDTLGARIGQGIDQFRPGVGVGHRNPGLKTMGTHFQSPQRLLHRFLKGATNRHHLAH